MYINTTPLLHKHPLARLQSSDNNESAMKCPVRCHRNNVDRHGKKGRQNIAASSDDGDDCAGESDNGINNFDMVSD